MCVSVDWASLIFFWFLLSVVEKLDWAVHDFFLLLVQFLIDKTICGNKSSWKTKYFCSCLCFEVITNRNFTCVLSNKFLIRLKVSNLELQRKQRLREIFGECLYPRERHNFLLFMWKIYLQILVIILQKLIYQNKKLYDLSF